MERQGEHVHDDMCWEVASGGTVRCLTSEQDPSEGFNLNGWLDLHGQNEGGCNEACLPEDLHAENFICRHFHERVPGEDGSQLIQCNHTHTFQPGSAGEDVGQYEQEGEAEPCSSERERNRRAVQRRETRRNA